MHISFTLQHLFDVPHVDQDPLLNLTGVHGPAGAKEEGMHKD
jgi:hypothetical protein